MKGKYLLAAFLMLGLWGCSGKTEASSSASAGRPSSKENSAVGEYRELDQENAFYDGEKDALVHFIENGTGVVFFGDPGSDVCQKYVVKLNRVLQENGLQAAVFNLKEIQADADLSDQVNHLLETESGNSAGLTEAPLTVFLNNGKVTDADQGRDTEEELNKAAREIHQAQQDSQNKGCEKACTFGGD